jgi:hypothetical protein
MTTFPLENQDGPPENPEDKDNRSIVPNGSRLSEYAPVMGNLPDVGIGNVFNYPDSG